MDSRPAAASTSAVGGYSHVPSASFQICLLQIYLATRKWKPLSFLSMNSDNVQDLVLGIIQLSNMCKYDNKQCNGTNKNSNTIMAQGQWYRHGCYDMIDFKCEETAIYIEEEEQ